jgi:hypothetical protein
MDFYPNLLDKLTFYIYLWSRPETQTKIVVTFFFVDRGSVEQVMQQNASPSADYQYNHSLKFCNAKFSLFECVINKLIEIIRGFLGLSSPRVHNQTSIISTIPGALSKKEDTLI